MSHLAEHYDYHQMAIPVSADGRDDLAADASGPTAPNAFHLMERHLPSADIRKRLRWIPRVLIGLVVCCLVLAAWVWFEILWSL